MTSKIYIEAMKQIAMKEGMKRGFVVISKDKDTKQDYRTDAWKHNNIFHKILQRLKRELTRDLGLDTNQRLDLGRLCITTYHAPYMKKGIQTALKEREIL